MYYSNKILVKESAMYIKKVIDLKICNYDNATLIHVLIFFKSCTSIIIGPLSINN